MKRLTTLFLLCATAGVAAPEFGEIDYIDGGRDADGAQLFAISIDLNEDQNWKTYWRRAGQNGLDPLFDFSESANIADIKTYWPAPKIIGEDGVEAVGYDQDVTIVFALTPADPQAPILLDLNGTIGVCQNICVPINVEFSSVLNASYVIDGVSLQVARGQAFDDGEFCDATSINMPWPILVETKEGKVTQAKLFENGANITNEQTVRAYAFSDQGIIKICE